MDKGLLKNLDRKTILSLLAKTIHFETMPVDINTFLSDDYYLGESTRNGAGIYKVWKEMLNEEFPDPITEKSSFVCLNGATRCLEGNTKLHFIDGTTKTIEQFWLNKEYNKFIWSYDTINKKFAPDKIVDVKYSGESSTVIVNLSDGSSIQCTPNHKFLTIENNWVEAQNLKENTVLISLKTDRYMELMIITSAILQYHTQLNYTLEEIIEYQKRCTDDCQIPLFHNTFTSIDEFNICAEEIIRTNFRYTERINNQAIYVTSVKSSVKKIPVYDLVTEKYHNFIASDAKVIVHNTGKSNTSKIMITYAIHKLLCLGEDNANRYFELTPRPFVIGIGHKTKQQAEVLVNEVNELMDNSPYFIEQKNDKNSFIHKINIIPVRSPDDIIGLNLIMFYCSECNFFDVDKGTDLINSAIVRIEGTFQKGFGLFNLIILDSSDTDVEAVVPTFLKRNSYGRDAIQYKFSRWEVKPHLYYHKPDMNRIDNYDYLINSLGQKVPNENKGKPALTFRIYAGDAELHPCIITDKLPKSVLEKLDEDRFLDVPNELRPAFENDIETSLMDVCGRALEATNQYFNPNYVVSAFDLENKVHLPDVFSPEDIICCSFFDPLDTYERYLEEAIEDIPTDVSAFLRIDLGIANDRAGLSIGYIEDVGEINNDGVISYDPVYKIPISIGISRLPGEETNIQKLINLITWVHSKRYLYHVSTDTFQSFAIKQACISSDIKFDFISVDRSTTGYKLLKEALYRKKVHLIKNTVLKTEMLNVYYDEANKKVDHHEQLNAAGDIGSNSKDILDSCAGLVQDMYQSICTDFEGVTEPEIVADSMMSELQEKFMEEYIKDQEQRRYRSMMNKTFRSHF